MENVQRATPGALDRPAPKDRQKWFRLVTGAVDGHKTRFRVSGGDLGEHRRNPIALWGHGSGRNALGDPPDPRNVIGRVVDYEHTSDHLDVLMEFDTEPFADLVWRKVKAGLIRACSVGAVALETVEELVDGKKVPTFVRWVLKEASVVIIGSNSEAMALDRDASEAALVRMDDAPAAPVVSGEERDPPLPLAAVGTVGKRAKFLHQVASVALHDGDGRVAFGKRRDNGLWTMPGGHLERGESALDAARRELREEAGVRLPAEAFTHIGRGRVGNVVVHSYRADAPAGTVLDASGDPDQEIAEWRWAGREDDPPKGALHAPRNVTLMLLDWQPRDRAVSSRTARDVEVMLDRAAAHGPGGVAVESEPEPAAQTVSRGVVDHVEYPTVDGEWDASASVDRFARWASSDGSGDPDRVDWSKFRECFAWFDDEHPGLGAGKLPHHDVRGGRVVTVWRGVVAAAAALAGARGGVDIPASDLPAVKAHIGAHYREFDLTPPWEERAEQWADRDPLAAVAVARPSFDGALAPGVRSALRRGIDWHREGHAPSVPQATVDEARSLIGTGAWSPERARAAHAWFTRHGNLGNNRHTPKDPALPKMSGLRPTPTGVDWDLHGGDAGATQVKAICAALDASAHAAERAALRAVLGLREASLVLLQRDLSRPYLPHTAQSRSIPAVGAVPVAVQNQIPAPLGQENKMALPKLDPQHHAAMRGLIGHQCDAAEMHAQAHDALPPEHTAMRAMHRDMASRCLRDAEELQRAHTEAHGQHFVMDDEGAPRVPPMLRDADLKRSFDSVYASLGSLPPSLRTVVRDNLGTDDPSAISPKLAAMKDDSDELARVQAEVRTSARDGAIARTDALIAEFLGAGRITPARARQMQGHDPATYVAGAKPTLPRWSEQQVRDYVATRAAAPVAEITRSAPLHVVDAPAGAAPPAPGTPLLPAAQPASQAQRPSMVRAGQSQLAGNVNFLSAAQSMHAEINRAAIPGQAPTGGPTPEEIAETADAIQRGDLRFARPSGGMVPLGSGGGGMSST